MAGFTLVEVMVAMAIIAIIAGIAIPNLRQFMDKTRVSTHANDLMSDLNLARMESGNRGQQITVCGSTDGSTCTGDATGWSSGRIVFVDADKDGSRSNSETLLLKGNPVDSSISITVSGFPNTSYVGFLPYGGLNPSGTGAFRVCPVNANSGSYGRQIALPSTGRVTSSAAASCT